MRYHMRRGNLRKKEKIMLKIKFIVLGTLSEKHWKDACDEYKKRLGATCKITEIQLKEEKLPSNPSDAEIEAALEAEAKKILTEISPRSVTVALCIEGKQLSSLELAAYIDKKMSEGASEINFIIGSSFGLSDKVKNAADFKFSMSKLTFPHQLARVMLYETVYRAGEINRGTKYHK